MCSANWAIDKHLILLLNSSGWPALNEIQAKKIADKQQAYEQLMKYGLRRHFWDSTCFSRTASIDMT